jgi:hypothetical protein
MPVGCDVDHRETGEATLSFRLDEKELTVMTRFAWSFRGVVVSVAVVALVAVAATISIGLAYPEPVSSGALGPDWQCTRLAMVLTSCARVARTETVATVAAKETAKDPAKDLLCRRGTAWRSASTSR